MALVACKKCGHQVSSRALQCPACQEQLQPATQLPRNNGESGMVSGYQPATLLKYSHHLISIAQLMMLVATLFGGYLGWKLAPLMAFGRTAETSDLIIGALIGGVSGLLSVGSVAFLYIYIAQLSLCLLQIEKNTRH